MPEARNVQRTTCMRPQHAEAKHDRHVTESRNQPCRNPTKKHKKKKFLFVNKLRGLGCKGTSMPASTPAIIRSAADWEAKRSRKHNQNKRKKQVHDRRIQGNVVVDVPDVCCAPPGIGIASDFAPRTRNSAPRLDHRKHSSREARRNEDDPVPEFPAILSGGVGSRINQRAAGEIIEMLMFRQTQLSGGLIQEQDQDQYQEWRLNVDHMSYEELLDLGDQIGYVGTGLQEEEILSCLRKPKHIRLLMSNQREWICSICQEKYRRDDEIGTLDCGHHHHLHCIKQWLLYKNACPVCKSAAMRQMIQ